MAQDMWSDKLESMQLERQLREGRRQRQQAENEQRLPSRIPMIIPLTNASCS